MQRFIVLLAAVLLPGLLWAQVPNQLGYQGRLLRADGAPATGLQEMHFEIYAQAEGGTPLWGETQQVPLTQGYYALYLGSLVDLPAGLFDGSPLFLQVTVGGDTLAPRQQIVSVPYALACTEARNVSGGAVQASSVVVNGRTVIGADGTWVGESTGLQGAPGADASFETDSDGDGAPDYVELSAGTDPNDPASTPIDTDGDGSYLDDLLTGDVARPTHAGRLIEGEDTDAAADVGQTLADPTASSGQVRLAFGASASGGTTFVAYPGTPAIGSALGTGLTRATFRMKVTNHTVQPTTALAVISCGASRAGTWTTLDERTLTPGTFSAGNTWQTFNLYCEFRPDDEDQAIAVSGFVPGITDIALDFVQVDPVDGAGVPPGMIAMFASGCPHGWSEYTALRGRFPRGEPTGNPASLGTGGSDDAVVVGHTHGVTDPGHGHLLRSHNDDFNCAGDANAADGTFGIARCPDNGRYDWPANNATILNRATGVSVQAAGQSGAGANLPRFQEIIFCVKN